MKWLKSCIILSAGVLVLLTGCSYQFYKREDISIESVSAESSNGQPASPQENSTQENLPQENLTQENIDFLCGKLYHTVLNCRDGSQVIVTGIGNDHIYLKDMPEKREDGNYEFFSHFHPSYDVTYSGGRTVTIPVHINDSDTSRFLLDVDYSIEDGGIIIEKAGFTFLNQKDKEFQQMYGALDSMAQMEYRQSLVPDQSMPKDQLAGFYRACIYNGNLSMLDSLYGLTPETAAEDIELRYKLELAGSRDGDSSLSFSDSNPYLPEIYYGESCDMYPQRDTLEFLAEHMQRGGSPEEMGAELLEPNIEWEEVCRIPSLKKLYPYLDETEQTTGIYRYDLDQDGLPEILILFPGGSMGNYFWEVLHLDEAGGMITHTNSGEGIGSASLYRYQGDYFFLSGIIDFNDKELLGWKIHALNQKGQMYIAEIGVEKTGVETVFTDPYIELEEYYDLDWMLESYIDRYKRYETTAAGWEIDAGEDVQELFQTVESPIGVYGSMDVNNDGVDDWTNGYKFETSTRYPYYCRYLFVDGKTKQIFDAAEFENLSYNLRDVFPYTIGDKNYFICLLNGYGNYVFKLIEIRGMEPVEIQSWFAAVRNRVLVRVYESDGARIGV